MLQHYNFSLLCYKSYLEDIKNEEARIESEDLDELLLSRVQFDIIESAVLEISGHVITDNDSLIQI